MQRPGPAEPSAAGGGSARDPRGDTGGARTPGRLDRELRGDLPCVMCGYNLRGLSIREVCPECSTPIRATILAVVDPHASELQPIARPGLVATGLVLWPGAALGAVVLWMLPRVMEVWGAITDGPQGRPDFTMMALPLVALSGIGGLALVRPHAGLGAWRIGAAALGVLAYAPLVWAMWHAAIAPGPTSVAGALRGIGSSQEAAGPRLIAWALIAAIALLMRPNARVLVARSLALRTGRVDRQTLAAVALAALVAGAGEAVALLATDSMGALPEGWALLCVGLITMGSALLTLGLAGALVDCVRITRALRVPAPSLRDVLRPAHAAAGSGGTTGGGSA